MKSKTILIFILFHLIQILCLENVLNPNEFYYKHWCRRQGLRFLDDSKCARVFPSKYPPDRDFECPSFSRNIPFDYKPDLPIEKVFINETAFTHLKNKIPFLDKINFALILMKRDKNGKPFYKYLSVNKK